MVVLQPVLILFIIMGLGFIGQRTGLLPPELRENLTVYVVNLAMPLFILNNINFGFDREILFHSGQILLISLATNTILMLISMAFAKRSKLPEKVLPAYQFALVFGNVGFMGYPVIAGLFGEQAMFYAVFFYLGFEIFIWTYGVSIFQRGVKFSPRKLITPNLVALAIGLTMFLLNLSWPAIPQQVIQLVGQTASPLSMLVLGMMLANFTWQDLVSDFKPLLISFYRLILVPLVGLGILWSLGLRGLPLVVPAMLFGMPVAAYGAILASYYKKDYHEAARLIVVSTLLSVITVPLIGMVLLKLLPLA